MIIIIITIFLLAVAITAVRLYLGPTPPDRILAMDAITHLIVTLLIVLSYFYQKWYLLDIAIVYILLSYVGTLALAKYIRGDL